MGFSTVCHFVKSRWRKNPLQKLTSPRHQTPCCWRLRKISRAKHLRWCFFLKPRLQKIVDSPYATGDHPPQPEPSNQTFTKTSKPRQVPEAEFGEPGFIPPKKNPMVLVWMSTWDVFFFVWVMFFFSNSFCFGPHVFFFPVVWWFAYVYEGVMIAILWYWRFLPWWLDVNVECWTCFWWMIVPMPPRIPTTAGPPKSCQPHISQKGLRLPTCSILPWYLSKCGVAH